MLVLNDTTSNLAYVVAAADPFSLDETFEFMFGISAGHHPKVTLTTPSIFDLRHIDLLQIAANDIKNYIHRRMKLTDPPQCGAMAVLCTGMGNFAMLRMFGIYSDVYGYRPEDDFLPTEHVKEAAQFIGLKTGLTANEQIELQVILAVDPRGRFQ